MRVLLICLFLVLSTSCTTQKKAEDASRKLANDGSLNSQAMTELESLTLALREGIPGSRDMSDDDWDEFVHQKKYKVSRAPALIGSNGKAIAGPISATPYDEMVRPWKKLVKYVNLKLSQQDYYKYPNSYMVQICNLTKIPSKSCNQSNVTKSISAKESVILKQVVVEKAAKHLEVIYTALLKNNFKCLPTIMNSERDILPLASHDKLFCGEEWAVHKIYELYEKKPREVLRLLSLAEPGLENAKRPVFDTNSESYKWLKFMVSTYPGAVASEEVIAKGKESIFARQLVRGFYWKPQKPNAYTSPGWESRVAEIGSVVSDGLSILQK